jgi:hypothetical protein
MAKGTFITLRIQDAKKIENEPGIKIFGVRFAKFLPLTWLHLNGLTPSAKLLSQMKELEKNGDWNEESFQTLYRPQFLKEKEADANAKKELLWIAGQLTQGLDIYYACYCQKCEICHRSLVARMFEKVGFSTIKG